ncbi:MAG: ATP-binding cassette domain-containing protein [Ilumatobacteraceae bacterium]
MESGHRAGAVIGWLRARQEWALAGALRRADGQLATAWWIGIVLRGTLPALLTVASGWLVAAVTDGSSLTPPLIAFGVVFVLAQLLGPLHEAVGYNLGDRTSTSLNDRLMATTLAPAGIAHLERADLAGDLSMARDFDLGITGPPLSYALNFVADGLVNLVIGVASAVVLATLGWWQAILLVVAWSATHWLLRESAVWNDRNTPEVQSAQRHADYAYRLAVDPPAAKEVRLFGLAGWVIDRFAGHRRHLLDLQHHATRLRERSVAACLAIVIVANLIVFWSFADRAADGRLDLADAVVALQAAIGVSAIAFGGLSWAVDGAAAPVAAVARLEATMPSFGRLDEPRNTAFVQQPSPGEGSVHKRGDGGSGDLAFVQPASPGGPSVRERDEAGPGNAAFVQRASPGEGSTHKRGDGGSDDLAFVQPASPGEGSVHKRGEGGPGDLAFVQPASLGEGSVHKRGDGGPELRFEDLSFHYPGGAEGDGRPSERQRAGRRWGVGAQPPRDERPPVLEHLDLVIPAGSSMAIVGQNGAGKTTLAKLLCRLYNPTGGSICADGVDLRDLPLDAWRRRVTAVFQDFVRFDLPLRANVAPAGASDEVILAALAEAGGGNLASLDPVLAKGYPSGTDLSGGQWQRVALARALAAVRLGADVVLLDEPTAQLDVRGEAEIFERILAATRGCTTILVSHRFSTVRHAERICVLEHGAVVELGSHDELMDRRGRYRTMFELQASRFVELDEHGEELVHDTLG